MVQHLRLPRSRGWNGDKTAHPSEGIPGQGSVPTAAQADLRHTLGPATNLGRAVWEFRYIGALSIFQDLGGLPPGQRGHVGSP